MLHNNKIWLVFASSPILQDDWQSGLPAGQIDASATSLSCAEVINRFGK
jgi:hypothetical protein